LTYSDISHLCFLEIGDHPDVRQWRQGDHLGSNADILALLDLPSAHHSARGGCDPGTVEVDPRQIAQGLLGLERRNRLCPLGVQHDELLSLLIEFCAVRAERRVGALLVVDGLFDELVRSGDPGAQQSLLANSLQAIARHVRFAGADIGFRLRHNRRLQELLLVEALYRRASGRDIASRLLQLSAVIVIDDLDQQLPAASPGEVLHRETADISGRSGRERRQIGLQIGVVGGLKRCGTELPTPFAGRARNSCLK